jgi:hypothetical protein
VVFSISMALILVSKDEPLEGHISTALRRIRGVQ